MISHSKPEPVGGPLWTPAFKILAAIFGVSALLMIWRFAAGLGATTGLSDGYPWGIWIAFDVVTGTALGCGGYAMAFLVYIFNKGEYHPLVRPAVLTSALGYTMAAVAIHLDVGRPPFIYKIPIFPGWWNLNSVLLEVALCVMIYVGVLWLELSPAFFEQWQKKGAHPTLKKVADTFSPIVNTLMIPILAVGVLLPSMHQTSLGALMLLGGQKVHGLWQTPFMPLLFLITCIAMGYGVVVMESQLATTIFHRRRETQLLARMAVVPAYLTLAYLAIRLVDIVLRGRLGLAFAFNVQALMFWVEMALFIGGTAMLFSPKARGTAQGQFQAAMLLVLAGVIYRLDAYLVAYNPGRNWTYFPAVPEVLITVGIVAAELMAYLYIVKRYPILGGASEAAHN